MYKVEWDEEINGIQLVISSTREIIPPRPVFYEELDLLGLDKYWDYPKCEEPVLWSIGRKYFYRGQLVAEVRGGNIFEEPKVKVTDKGKNLVLEPVDVKSLVERNKEALRTLENEAIDFINETYNRYRNRVDYFIVSYSGGKDSQVVLDLVSRTIPPDEFMVIFTDTTMEIPPTYEVFEKTKKYYTTLYPKLKFFMVRNEQHSYDLWRIFGPPSRIIRWCCSVYKTSPQVRFLRRLNPDKPNLKILVFDGVRAEESARRRRYSRITEEGKHITFINSSIILNWRCAESFLYLFYRDVRDHNSTLILNKGYRYGLSRVGCSMCPFSSPWSEFVINRKFPELAEGYIDILRTYAENLGIEEKEINNYIMKGNWKKRAGGRGVYSNVNIITIQEKPFLKAVISSKNNIKNSLTWFKTAGNISILQNGHDKEIHGELLTQKKSYKFFVKESHEKSILEVHNVDEEDVGTIKRILNKIAYCIKCGVCEAECSSGALKLFPKLEINSNKCIHCLNCINFNIKGCLLAWSLTISKGGEIMKSRANIGFNKYLTFGLREEWLNSFIKEKENWFIKNNLGNMQFSSMISWLKDAELIEKKESFKVSLFTHIFENIRESNLLWEIIWINLFYNSNLIGTYLKNFRWGTLLNKDNFIDTVKHIYPHLSERNIKNAYNSLLNTFESTPLGRVLKIGLIEKIGRERVIRKIGTDEVHPVAILYSLYRYAISKNRYRLTISELYKEENKDGGPYLLFGISRGSFENILRWLSDKYREYIYVEITADLDNINLSENIKNHVDLMENIWQEKKI